MEEHPDREEGVVSPGAEDRRQAYEPPELKEHGDVTDLTQTGASNPGSDGIYS